MSREAGPSPRIVLVLVVGHDLRLFERHLRHYRALGVDRIVVDIQTGSGNADQWLESAKRAARTHEAEIVSIAPGPYVGTRARRERIVDDYCRSDDWLVIADLDEFHEYPTRLDRLVDYCESGGYDFVMGEFVDRVGPDGATVALDDQPLSVQFPVGCHLTRNLCGGWSRKVVLARPWVRIVEGNHEALAGRGCPEDRIYVPIHHFRWDAEVAEKNRYMIESIRERGLYHWIEKDRLLRHLDSNGGRIDVNDHRLASRPLGGLIPAVDNRPWPSGAQAMISPVSPCHRRPLVTPCTWMDHVDCRFEVHAPRGTARSFNTPVPAFLWSRSRGAHSVRQIILDACDEFDRDHDDISKALTRTIEQWRGIGAIRWHDERRDEAIDEPVRLLFVDERVPREAQDAAAPGNGPLLRALVSNGFAVTMFPVQGLAWDDTAHADALAAAGIAVVTHQRQTTLERFLSSHLEWIDVIWVRGRRRLDDLVDDLSGRSRRPVIILDDDAETVDGEAVGGSSDRHGDGVEAGSAEMLPPGADIVVCRSDGRHVATTETTPVFAIPRQGSLQDRSEDRVHDDAAWISRAVCEIRRCIAGHRR